MSEQEVTTQEQNNEQVAETAAPSSSNELKLQGLYAFKMGMMTVTVKTDQLFQLQR